MDRLTTIRSTGRMTTTEMPTTTRELDADQVQRLVARRSFATLATSSPRGVPHVAGVLYAAHGPQLYVSTLRESRKARNVAASGRAAVCVPVRRLPVGPPSSVQWQAHAEVLDLDDPELRRLAAAGELDAITGHGELELDGGCVLRLTPSGRLHTYGVGMSIPALVRDPLDASGVVAR